MLAGVEPLLGQRGRLREVDGHVVGVAFSADGATLAGATAEGTLFLTPARGDAWTETAAHDGAILSLAVDRQGFLTGGDDGALCRTEANGRTAPFARFGGRWVERIDVHLAARGPALIAASAGRRVMLLEGDGNVLKTLEHPSTVTGLVFDAKGKRICASHVDGASLWFVAARVDTARRLGWKGSHIGIAIHPGGEALVTAMQENALHGWRLSDDHDMRMSGYPAKTHALSFSRTGRWLATSGADAIVLWPFFGGGPMGKPPLELGGGRSVLCTQVAFHPTQDMVAAGFADGSVLLAETASERLLPVADPGRGPVSALAWSPDGSALAFGTEAGDLAVIDLARRDP